MTEHEFTYEGPLHVRPVGRGIILGDLESLGPDLTEWMEDALSQAGVLDATGRFPSSSRVTGPVKLTLRIEEPDQ